MSPIACYAFAPNEQPGRRIVIVRPGERGYHLTTRDAAFITEARAREIVDELNALLHVKPEDARALFEECTRRIDTDTDIAQHL